MYADVDQSKFSDQQFIEQIYHDFKLLMYYTARKYNINHYVLEDIVQESLLKLIQKIDVLKKLNRTTIACYIVVTVRNTSIDYLKTYSNEHLICIDDVDKEVAFKQSSLDDYILKKEMISNLYEIWANLPFETRLILEGKYVLEYNDKQLSNILGCKVSSIRMQLTRARRELIKHLNGGGKSNNCKGQ